MQKDTAVEDRKAKAEPKEKDMQKAARAKDTERAAVTATRAKVCIHWI